MEDAWQGVVEGYRRERFEVKRARVVVQSGGINDHQGNRMLTVKSEHVIYNGESQIVAYEFITSKGLRYQNY